MAVVPIVIGPLRAVSDMFEKYMGKLDVTIRLEVIQKTALLGTAEEGFVRRDSGEDFGTYRNLLLLAPKEVIDQAKYTL